MISPRLLAFDAIDNFRDFGDYAVASGGRIAPGRLYRSAHHARTSDADLARLATLDIGTVVDLRRPIERRRQPSRRHPDFDAQTIENDLDEMGEAPHITFLKTTDLTPESGRRFMIGSYARMPFAPSHLDLFSRYFRALAQTERPVLIHCAAGKDRTGLLVAMTHHLLGVGRDDLIADYLLTNLAVDLPARAPDIARQLQALSGRVPAHDAVVAFLGVEADFLHAAFAAIDAECGSLDGYLERAVGLDRATIQRLVVRLTA